MKKFATISPGTAVEIILKETFTDVLVAGFTGSYSTLLGEFTVVDDVPLSTGKKLLNIFNKGTVLARKGQGCETNWKQIGSMDSEDIKITELSAGIKQCDDDFFTGCLKDYRAMNKKFKELILNFFKMAIGLDMMINAYFGDVARASDKNDQWQWNTFDGILTHYKNHINSGKLPAAQTMSIGAVNTPQDAFNLIKGLYDKRSNLVKTMDKRGLGIYVTSQIADLYDEYLTAIGQGSCCGVGYVQDGISTLKYKGIGIYVEPVWEPVLTALNNGKPAHLAVLCPRKSWVFGMNKNYGGGENLDQAFKVWYNDDDEQWKAKYWLTAGTAIASVENHVFAISEMAAYDPNI